MSICFSESMIAMSGGGGLGSSLYSMLCNENDGAIWSLESVVFSVLEVAAAVIVVVVVVVAVKRFSEAARKG